MKYFSFDSDLPGSEHQRTSNMAECDVVVVHGGDGTLLRALHKILNDDSMNWVPEIFGLNRGTVGFLANDISDEDAVKFLNSENITDYISQRHLLSVDHSKYAFNEVVIQPEQLGRLFEVQVSFKTDNVRTETLTYKGDGLIISTATGSTAYNMSAYGPIVHPESDAMILTPLAPFSLAARPLVLNSSVGALSISTKDHAHVTIDGNYMGSFVITEMMVEIASFMVSLIKLSTFIDSIHEKLGWNHNIK